MPKRRANASALPGVGDATATTSASSGIIFTEPAMQSAWKREPTMPTFTRAMRGPRGAGGRRLPRGTDGREAPVPSPVHLRPRPGAPRTAAARPHGRVLRTASRSDTDHRHSKNNKWFWLLPGAVAFRAGGAQHAGPWRI